MVGVADGENFAIKMLLTLYEKEICRENCYTKLMSRKI